MKQILGVIESIEVKGPFNKNNSTFYVHAYKLQGEVDTKGNPIPFVKFSKSEVTEFNADQTVTIFYEENKNEKGTTNKIVEIHLVGDSNAPTGKKNSVPQQNHKGTPEQTESNQSHNVRGKAPASTRQASMEETQERISRSHAITAALTAIHIAQRHEGVEPKVIVHDAIILADQVRNYTTGLPF